MSNLLEQASLVMIPSGYKEDVVYSEIPLDGSGDMNFTRSSNGTRINSAGLVEVCPWNLLEQSETFDNAIWSKTSTTIVANAEIAPNGTMTADTMTVPDSATNLFQAVSYGAGEYTFSVYVKVISTTTSGAMRLQGFVDGANVSMNFTPTTEWQLFTQTFTVTTSITSLRIRGQAFVGTLAICGAQLNIGSTAKPYFPTTDRLNVPRLTYQNGGGGCPSLLLEPQRTNVVLHSGDLSQSVWATTNYALTNVTAIQGLTATRITKNSTNNGTWNSTGSRAVINNVGTFASGTKAFSVLLRKGNTAKVGLLINQILVGALTNVVCEFDFSTETFTNVSSGLTPTFEKITTDVYEIILVCNDTGTATNKALWIAPINSSNNTVTDGYVDVAYFQWEAGAYPTSYIPTTSSSATRVIDDCRKTGISSLIGQSEGTLFIDLNLTAWDSNTFYFGIYGGGNEIYFRCTATGSIGFVHYFGSTQAQLLKSGLSLGRHKLAACYKNNDWAFYVDGILAGTDNSGTFSGTISEMVFGYTSISAYPPFQSVNQAILFPTRLTNAELASLTTI
jgi:hypothetical protein